MTDPKPKLQDNPLRGLLTGETQREWSTAMLAHTLAELGMTPVEWASYFKQSWPGDGYRNTLEAQAKRLREELSWPTN